MELFAKINNRRVMFFVSLFSLSAAGVSARSIDAAVAPVTGATRVAVSDAAAATVPAATVPAATRVAPGRISSARPAGQSLLSLDPLPGHPGDPGDTIIRVSVSDTFSVALKASFGEGFSWQLRDSSFAKRLRYLWQDHHPTGARVPGGQDIQVFYFKALAAGSAQIRLIYVQPFRHPYKTSAPRKTVSIIIH